MIPEIKYKADRTELNMAMEKDGFISGYRMEIAPSDMGQSVKVVKMVNRMIRRLNEVVKSGGTVDGDEVMNITMAEIEKGIVKGG